MVEKTKVKKEDTKKLTQSTMVTKQKNTPVSRKVVKAGLNEMHAKSRSMADARVEYTRRKAHAQLLEQTNDSKIIVFKSIDEPWHKIGWNSVLIYAYDVALRACKKKDLPTIRKDTDHELRSRDGIIFLRSLEKFARRLRDIGLVDCEELPDGIYIFDVKRTYSKSDLKSFRNTKYQKGDELFAMGADKKVYPELRGLIVKANATVMPKCKKIGSFYQITIGKRIADAVAEMNYAYFDLANGRGGKKAQLVRIVENTNVILADLTMLQELDLWNPIELVEVGGIMVDIKVSIRRLVKKDAGTGQE